MGAGWAIGSAAVLALGVATLALDPASRTQGAEGPALALVVLLFAAVHFAWALALVRAAHGSRGALLALLGNALAWGVGAGLWDASRHVRSLEPADLGPLALAALLVLAGAGAAVALVGETRARRGPLQAANALAMLAPTLLLAGLLALLARS